LLLIAAAALSWTVWLTRNEVIFDKSRPKSFLQVLFRGTHLLQQWAQLQRCEDLRNEGRYLEMSVFSQSVHAAHRIATSWVAGVLSRGAQSSSIPMDGCQLDLLPLLSSIPIVFILSSTFFSGMWSADSNFVIIDLILSVDR